MLDEGLLFAQGVRVRYVAYVVDAVIGVLGVVGEPLPVLLVNAHGDLLEPEDGFMASKSWRNSSMYSLWSSLSPQ